LLIYENYLVYVNTSSSKIKKIFLMKAKNAIVSKKYGAQKNKTKSFSVT